ncbi:MAG: hypothetical protein R6V04_09835 [bacterium]
MKNKILSVILLNLLIGMVSFVSAQQRLQNFRDRPAMNVQDMQRLTLEQEEQALEHIKATYPEEKYQKLLNIKSTRPAVYNRLLQKAYREMQYLDKLKERDPKQYEAMKEMKELEIQTKKLVDQYKNTGSESEKEKLKNQISELLNKIFDIRQQNRQKEIERLEKRLAEAKENNKKRLQNKDEIIAERLEDLLGKQDWMRW